MMTWLYLKHHREQHGCLNWISENYSFSALLCKSYYWPLHEATWFGGYFDAIA